MITEKVISVHHWSDRTFSFKTTRSQTFKFNAGEFAMCGLTIDGKNVLRAYSIVSPPWADELEFLSIKIADGQLTSKLQHIQVGDAVIMNPKSTGTLRNDALNKGGDLYLLGTGTGLAPFMSLIRDVETLETWDKITVVHSVRNRDDLAYYDLLSTGFAGDDLEEMGYDFRSMVSFIDKDDLLESLINDSDYGSALNGYDGNYDEININGTYYIVMRTD